VFEYRIARGSGSLGFMNFKGVRTANDEEYHIDASTSVENDINGSIEVTGVLVPRSENVFYLSGMLKDGSIEVTEWKEI